LNVSLTAPSDAAWVIGGGLAGAEAAWQLARRGIAVLLSEMRPQTPTPAHATGLLAELVCSNSFRSDEPRTSAVGLLHEELRTLDSLVLQAADAHRVPAGSALAVDRIAFSETIDQQLASHPLISIRREEVCALPVDSERPVIVATGPLTSPALSDSLRQVTGESSLAFFDAIAPIVHRESIDPAVTWFQSRYDKGEGADYINCPLSRPEYEQFVDALLTADTIPFRDWERDTPYFEGCLPIEVMAQRGRNTLLFGPMKPVGLRNPYRGGERPYAVVQLRQDNALATLFNMVGFQTKLRHAEQIRIFRMIPGLGHAEFVRLGGIHRNTFVNSPRVLDQTLRLRACPAIRLAGQLTGCEGYVESAAIGLLAARFIAAERANRPAIPPPATTAIGALLQHITIGADASTFQPMNINFGLFPPIEHRTADAEGKMPKSARREAVVERARRDLRDWAETEVD
jgi:methylenetetrahydrofolate--tRNA-(uracil-5-)-methyltransferase